MSTLIIQRALNKPINGNNTDDNNDNINFYLNLPYFGIAEC